MLIQRRFTPTEDGRLYHYCSPEAFLAICTSRTLRFSDVYSMNDSLEMHWGYRQWEAAAGHLLDSVGKEFLDAIDEIISASSLKVLPLVSCFSTQPDVLSQWRAYAQNGAGFCIGFKDSSLCHMAASPLNVLYDVEQQQMEIIRSIKALHKVHEEEKDEEQFFQFCVHLAADLAAMKNPAFKEEAEVRLVHLAHFVPSGQFLRLEAIGGTAFDVPLAPSKISFQMRGSVPSPHIDMSYCEPTGQHPIKEVILGPRNDARKTAVSVFLESVGLSDVEIKKSAASYR